MDTIKELCMYIGGVIGSGPICVETGCTYGMPPENEIHTTTNNIFQHIVLPNNGFLHSLDIDEKHIEFAKSLVFPNDALGLSCRFWLGDSVDSMKKLASLIKPFNYMRVSVLCLDSKEFDEDHMVNEYNAIKDVLATKHFVLADDIHNPNSVKYKKMVPILKDLGYDYMEIPTPTGLFLAAKGYGLPNE